MTFRRALGLMATFTALAAGAARAQHAEAGAAVFGLCKACHSIDGINGLGPGLKGVVGRDVGTHADFRFSRALKSRGGAWDARALDAFIADPQAAVPGNLMPFSGLSDAKQRADLVAYLATLK